MLRKIPKINTFKGLNSIFNFKYFNICRNSFKSFAWSKYSVRSFCTSDPEEKTNAASASSHEDLFIKEPSNEILPIKQKIADLIAENEEHLEYNRILITIKSLFSDFDLDKFKVIVTYINENQVTDVFLFKQFESIFVKNLNQIDYITKSTCVVMLCDYVSKKKTSFQEENWLIILKDFLTLVDNIGFAEYYNYISAFDRLFNKRKVHDMGKYSREFDNFISFQMMNIFNQGKVQMRTLEDIFMFSKLTHNAVIKAGSVSDAIWSRINKIVELEANDMNIYECLILTSLFINYQEISGKAHFILSDAIREVNKYLFTLIKNFELLENADQENIVNYADNIFNYYSMFIWVKRGREEQRENYVNNSELLQRLIKIYSEKLKSKNHDFMIFKEFRILTLLSKEVKYRDKEFWACVADKTMEYINKDFIKILNDIYPKRLLKNSAMTEEDKLRFQEKCDMQILLYVGMIIETFSSAEYVEKEFWETLFQKLNHFASFKNKDIFVMLNFVTLGCKRLYKKEQFAEVWELFTDLLDPKVRPIFQNREVVDFLVKLNSPFKEKDSQSAAIDIDELNKTLNILFLTGVKIDIPYVKLLSSFFTLIENKIKDDDKVVRVLANTLVDLVRFNEDNKQNDFELKFFQAKLRPLVSDNMGVFIKERITNLLKQNELTEESEKKSFYYLVRKMVNADFIDNMDIVRMKFDLSKGDQLTESKAVFFERLLKDD